MSCLLSFGDSWPCGAELKIPEEKSYPVLLSERLGLELWPYSYPGSSIPHLVIQLQNAINRLKRESVTDPTAVFFLTNPHRDMIWGTQIRKCDGLNTATDIPRIMHINPANPEDRRWYQDIHSQELADYRVNVTLMALQSMCQKHHIRDHYIWGWERVDLWPEIDRNRFWKQGDRTIWQTFSNDPVDEHMKENFYIKPNVSHPNQQGHELIAQTLYDFIRNH